MTADRHMCVYTRSSSRSALYFRGGGHHSGEITRDASRETGQSVPLADAPNVQSPHTQQRLVSWSERAKSYLHWHFTEHAAWLSSDDDDRWTGWSTAGATPIAVSSVVQPWSSESEASEAPFVRWFVGAHTNAAFNELDRHVLQVVSPSHRH